MFSVDVRQDPRGVVFALRGRLDFDSMVQLHEAGEKELGGRRGAEPVVIDCAGLSFCDSSGLNALLWLHKDLSAHDRALRLASVPAQLSRLFGLTGLDEALSVYADVPAALAGDTAGHATATTGGPAGPGRSYEGDRT